MTRDWVFYDPWLSAAILLMDGQNELAEKVIGKQAPYELTFEQALMYPYYTASAGGAFRDYYSSNFESAKSWAKRMKLTIRPQAENNGQMFWGNQNLPRQLMAELERRTGIEPPSIDNLGKMSDDIRRRSLIELLDTSGAISGKNRERFSAYGHAVHEGDAIVPHLIEAYRTDSRWSQERRSTLRSYVFIEPRPVREIILTCLRLVWKGIELPARLSGYDRADEAADWMLAKWESVKQLNDAERCLVGIQTVGVNSAELAHILGTLFLDWRVWRGDTWVIEREALVRRLNSSQKDELRAALDVHLKREVEKTPEYIVNLAFPLALARLNGHEAIPLLDLYMSKLIEKAKGAGPSSRSNFDDAVGTLTTQRIALGDGEAAVKDYEAFLTLPSTNTHGFGWVELFLPAWEFPENEALQKLVKETLTIELEDYLDGRTENDGVFHPLYAFAQATESYRSPAIQQILVELIRDESDYGLVFYRDISRRIVTKNENHRRLKLVQGPMETPDDAVAITKGDYVVYLLSEQVDGIEFELYESSLERRKQRERIVRMMESGNLLTLVPDAFRSELIYKAVYFPPQG